MMFVKSSFLGAILMLFSSLSACAQTCSETIDQVDLDEMFMEFYDPNAIPVFNPDNSGISMARSNCKYLANEDDTSRKVFEMFTFIDDQRYILYKCDFEKYTEVVAAPKYLKSHVEKVNGKCGPTHNPLNLKSYAIEFSNMNGELVKLYRMVE